MKVFFRGQSKKFANKIISISKNNKTLRKIGIKSNYVVLKILVKKLKLTTQRDY